MVNIDQLPYGVIYSFDPEYLDELVHEHPEKMGLKEILYRIFGSIMSRGFIRRL